MTAPTYRCAVIDPPWASDRGGGGRGAQEHYHLMPWRDCARVLTLAAVPRLEDDAAVWVWCTALSRPHVSAFGEALGCGLRYTGHRRVWIKGRPSSDGLVLHQGLGYWGRSADEELHLFVRGGYTIPPERRLPTVVLAPARGAGIRHSQKPQRVYDELRAQNAPGRCIEVFARRARPGWDAWGDEADA